MIVCTKCGAENPDGTRFCEKCDRYLDWNGVRLDEPARSAVSATLKPTDLTVEPGGQAACEVQVNNDGRLVDEYRLSLSGADPSWCSVEPASLRLMPKTSGAARVLFRPPRAPNPAAATIPFVITVSSTVDPAVKSDVAGSVTIATFADIVATLVPQTSESVRVAEHKLSVENRGNAPNRVVLTAQDPDDKLVCDLVPSVLAISPGSSAKARLDVRPRDPKQPRAGRRLPFQVVVHPERGTPVRLDGATVLMAPRPGWWSRWRLAIAAALALALIAAGVATDVPPVPWPWLPQASVSPSAPPTPPPTPPPTVTPSPPPSPSCTPVPAGAQPPVVSQKSNSTGSEPSPFCGYQRLVFMATRTGDSITLQFRVGSASTYYVVLGLAKSNDYGIYSISMPYVQESFDAYNPNTEAFRECLPNRILSAGPNAVRFTVVGENPQSTGLYLGIDYIRLEPAPFFRDTNCPAALRD